jgi:hypothetical protein
MHGTMTRTVVHAPTVVRSVNLCPQPRRPVLVGACDPRSLDPAHAFWPDLPGSSGHRVLELIRVVRPGAMSGEFLRAFRRENLCQTPVWDNAEARGRAMSLLLCLEPGTDVVILGEDARRAVDAALGLPHLLIHPQEIRGARGVRVRQLPHPSGRCRWYNHPMHRLVAALLLGELYDRYVAAEEQC